MAVHASGPVVGDYAAPALARGVDVLRALADGEAASAVELSERTGVPRSSLLRIMETLCQLGLVESVEGHTYRALSRLVPLAGAEAGFRLRLHRTLEALADETGTVAEWFLPCDDGMMLVDRAEPSGAMVIVSAREGRVFKWGDELDCVSALGYAWFGDYPTQGTLNRFVSAGVIKAFPVAELLPVVEAARRDRVSADTNWNDAGVRRSAALVTWDGKPRCVIALACNMKPGEPETRDDLIDALKRTAASLGS